jgi:hypothetical protein
MARPSNKIAPAAKKPAARPAARPQSDSVQQARKNSAAIAKAATPNAREDRAKPKKIVPKSDSVQAAIQDSKNKKIANMYKEAGPEYRGAGQNFYQPPPYVAPKDKGKKKDPPPPPDVPVVPPIATISIPVASGTVKAPNIQERYQALIRKLTLDLLKNAENLLFAYDFQTIERIASYVLDTDDAAQRGTNIVSNIKRSFSGVPTTELQIRDRLNAVINQISQEIGDLTPASTKLSKFGIKKDNDSFQGGTPRIENRAARYDLELTLPSLEGFNYSVSYRIKCYEIG